MPDEFIYITESSGYGGAEKYLLDISAAAKGRTKNISVALPYKRENEKLRLELKSMGVNIMEIKQYRANYLLNFFIGFKFFLYRRNAVCHFSLPYPDSCRWLLLSAALLRRRYIITELLVPANPFKAGVYFFMTHLLFNQLKKFSYRRAEKVIAICNEMKKNLVEKYHMPSDKITVIYTGIAPASAGRDKDRIAQLRRELGITDGSLVLTSVGRLTAQKGQMYLLSALEKLVARYPSLVLLLVGDGDLKDDLEARIRSRQLEAHVRLTGFRKDIQAILAITDLFVFPSLNEGLPYMVLEAMAAGNPVIATNVGGIPEAVIDGVTGLIVLPEDVQSLGDAIEKLINDPALRISMQKKSTERIKQVFSRERMLNDTNALYKAII